ncbi:MAG: hypothetical protein ACRDPU_03945 [Thermoleophilia bacterium]
MKVLPHARLEKMPVVTAVVPVSVAPWYRPYPTTPTLSEDADQERATLVAVREVTATFAGVDGAWVSTHGDVVPVREALVERFPAKS